MPTDLLLTTDIDVAITGADIAFTESTDQQQNCLLLVTPGELKQSPKTGVGIESYLKENDVNGLLGKIKSEFQLDGMNISAIAYDNNQLLIDANYQETSDTN